MCRIENMNRVLKDWLLQARNNENGQKGLEIKRERGVGLILFCMGMVWVWRWRRVF